MHHVSPYNEFGYNDFAHDRGYSRETMRGVAHYARPEIKYKKGGVAQIIGAIVAVVVTVWTGGLAAGALGLTGITGGIVGGAIGGALGGLANAVIGGGDIGKSILSGAAFGAIGGGISGAMGGFGSGSPGYDTGASWASGGEAAGTSGTAVAGGAGSISAPVGGEAGAVAAPVGNAQAGLVEGSLTQGGAPASGLTQGLDGAAATGAGQPAGVVGNLDAGGGSWIPGSVDQAPTAAGLTTAQFDSTMAGAASNAGVTGSIPTGAPANGLMGFAADAYNKAGDVLSNKGVQEAGLKIGGQLIGSMATAPGSGEMKSYLNDVKAMEQQSQQFNQNMATQKAGIGDKLQTNADNIDPQYYAMQGMTQTKNRDANAWSDQEARMRAQGASQDAIDAERHRQGIQSSQNQGTAYDSGYMSGRNQQNSTYGAAGGMYGQVSSPTAGLAGAYNSMNNANAQAQKDWGYGIEQAGQVLTGTSKKTNQNTSE